MDALITKIVATEHELRITITGMDASKRLRVSLKQPYEEEYSATVVSFREEIGEDLIRLYLPRFADGADRLYARIDVYEAAPDGPLHRINGVCFVTGLENISRWKYPYPQAKTIKGLQVKRLDDALTLGLGHAALNVNLPCMLLPRRTADCLVFETNGKTYFFDRAYMQRLDADIRALSAQGVVVALILICRAEWCGVWADAESAKLLLHPNLHPEGIVSAFSVLQEAPLEALRACVEFLAERYMRPDGTYGRACGLIVGNEVNAQWIYSNGGELPIEEFVRQYEIALRTVYYAARKYYQEARVYISLDHNWNMRPCGENPLRSYPGHALLDLLNERVRALGDFDWDIAYHPYPEDLARSDFWNDTLAVESFDTPKISFKNLEILVDYLAQPDFLYCGKRRKISLSEQGFCSGHTPKEEQQQADAFVLAYQKVLSLPQIEAFIYHSHIDEPNEGLYLGLLAEDGREKPIYACFRDMDGENAEELYPCARKRIGAENCKKVGL